MEIELVQDENEDKENKELNGEDIKRRKTVKYTASQGLKTLE